MDNPYYCDRCKLIHDKPSKECDDFIPGEFSEAQAKRLYEIAAELRSIAAPTGTLSALWNVIFDIELFLKKGRPQLKFTAEEWIVMGEARIISHYHIWKK